MMIHHHTKSGHKGSVIQIISAGQTLTAILNLHCDFDFEHSNPIFSQDTPAYNDVPSNYGRLQKNIVKHKHSDSNIPP